MKRFLSLALLMVLMLSLALTSCGKKQVRAIEIDEGLKYEYELGETPDFSGVKATIVYNDETTTKVNANELNFGTLDTSTSGKKNLEISYEGFTTTVQVTVKSKSISGDSKELVSINYVSGIPANVYVGDDIPFSSIVILAKYSDGSEETKTASNPAVKHNGADISTATAGEKTLTITYMGKTCEYIINVQEIVVVGLEVTNANLNVIEGTEFDPTDMKVEKVFNNGGKIAVSIEELTITQNDDTVTIALGSVSTTLKLNVQDPSVTSITLDTTNFQSAILVGDSINTSTINITAKFNNGITNTVSNSDVTFSAIDTNKAGTYTVTVTYNADTNITATFEVTVLDIKSIAIDASSIDTYFPAGTEFDYSGIKINITASNDALFVGRGLSDGVTVDVSNLDTTKVGDDYSITASFRGVTSSPLTIKVHDRDVSYIILDVDLPDSIKDQTSKRNPELFKVLDNPYVVGDDNPYIFKLKLDMINESGEYTPEDDFSYRSYFEVWMDERELTAEEYALYVDEINEEKNSVDFSVNAIGKTFTIKTRPADGISDSDIERMTREHTVTIVDGLNIYEAWELNYLTNYNDFELKEQINGENRSLVQIVLDFLKTKGVYMDSPKSLAGIVLHNDLDIKKTDIPAEFFHETGDFYDFLTVFSHATDKDNPNFTFHGNYFTIMSYDLPNVVPKGTANNDDKVSSAQLFRFSCAELNNTDFNLNDYSTKIQNVSLRDDHPNKDVEATANRDMLGLIAMKVQFQKIEADNINVTAYLISFFLDNDYTVAELKNSVLHNSYQSHIYSYNKNPISGDDTAPAANYSPITLTITDSKITKCGGPVILNQTEHPEYTKNSKSGAQVTIDDATEIWTWVTGTEAWFKAIGAETTASQISGLGYLLAQNPMLPKTFVRPFGENGLPGPTGQELFMNMVMVNLVAGTDFETVIGFKGDLDGTFTKGGIKYLDMTDTVALDGTHGYGSQTVATEFAKQAGAGKEPIIINTHTDGTIVIDKDTASATPTGNMAGLGDGDMVAIYYGCFGFVFGFGPFQQ